MTRTGAGSAAEANAEGAPGKTPFVAAVEINREGRPVRMRLSRVGAFQSDEIAAWAKCRAPDIRNKKRMN